MKTLVLGGYGNFGARICRALANDAGVQLQVAGRNLARAQAMAREVGGSAQGVEVDIDAPGLAARFRALGAEVVVHAAGPFQGQGYGVALAAAEAGAHYVDLADGRRFVCDFVAATDAVFRAAGRSAFCGASTIPALSSAAVAHLCAGWQRIDTIDTCIAPGHLSQRGVATIGAALSYCGKPVAVWRDGAWTSGRGWARPRPVSFARIAPRRGALCDTPDLELFPARYAVTQRVDFKAALEVPFGQWAFALLARLHAMGIVRRPERCARLLDVTAGAVDFLGTALGGMVVRVQGADAQGRLARRAWHVTAGNGHGPEIPCMAAVLLVRRLARETVPAGAQVCLGVLPMAAFAPEFARWGMITDTVDEPPRPSPRAVAEPGAAA